MLPVVTILSTFNKWHKVSYVDTNFDKKYSLKKFNNQSTARINSWWKTSGVSLYNEWDQY